MTPLGKIAFITPEYNQIIGAGGVGKIVNELCESLASLEQDISVVIPYYKWDRNGKVLNVEAEHIFNMKIELDSKYYFSVFKKKINGVILYLCKNEFIFPSLYTENVEFFLNSDISRTEGQSYLSYGKAPFTAFYRTRENG